MARTHQQTNEGPGQDSFLDIVANMVGIMIILVLVTGMRVRNAPVAALAAGPHPQVAAALTASQEAEAGLQSEVAALRDELTGYQQNLASRFVERARLSDTVAALQQELGTRRQKLDGQAQEAFDLKRQLAEADARLTAIRGEQIQVESMRPSPTTVEVFPTPLAHVVEDKEIHCQLRGGLIAVIPWEELVSEFKREAREKVQSAGGSPDLTHTIGPRDGFRMRYTLVRRSIPADVQMRTGVRGTMWELDNVTLVPVSSEMGEPLAEALAPGSAFRDALSRARPGRTVVTLWVYDDSFAVYRDLQRELYKMGFASAARPLAHDTPISASPDGTKSTAQ